MMKTAKHLLCCALIASTLISTSVFAASWQGSLSGATNELSKQSSGSRSSSSFSSLTSPLNGSSQSLISSSMSNATGVLEYCTKQKLASVTDTQGAKNQVLDKLGFNAPEQRQDTSYMDGIQGLLNAKDGQQLNLDTIGNSSLAKQVKTKACGLVLKQGMNFTSWRTTCHV